MTTTAAPLPRTAETKALGAILLGAVAIGASPIFVRLAAEAGVGPFAAAFWRVFLALPVLYVWMRMEERTAGARPSIKASLSRPIVIAGALFAGDLFFWHLSILNTTVTNATLFANFSVVVTALGAWVVLKEPVTKLFAVALILALAGAGLLAGASYTLDPDYLLGDFYGVVTAVFFGSYMIAIRFTRRGRSAASIMFWSSCVTAAILGLIALVLSPRFFPGTAEAWAVLLALAWISHAGGQGLLAYGLGILPAGFSALVVLLEPIAAALLAWLILFEPVSWLQAAGGAVILAGVLIARASTRKPPEHTQTITPP